MSQILVVDDEVGIRELLSEILRDEGHQVRLAENAGEARAGAQPRPPRSGAARHLDARHRRHHAAQGMGHQRPAHHAGGDDVRPRHHRYRGRSDAHRRLRFPGKADRAAEAADARSGRRCAHRLRRRSRRSTWPTWARRRSSRSCAQRLETIKNLEDARCCSPASRVAARACARAFCISANTPWVAPENFAVLDDPANNLVGQAAEGTLFLHGVSDLTPRTAAQSARADRQARALPHAADLLVLRKPLRGWWRTVCSTRACSQRSARSNCVCRACASIPRTCPSSPS